MWRLGTWFSGGLGSVRFTVGLNDLKGLFQPKFFYGSMPDAVGAKGERPALMRKMPGIWLNWAVGCRIRNEPRQGHTRVNSVAHWS